MVDTVAHPCLRGQMYDHVRLKSIGHRIECVAVFQQRLFGGEMLMLEQHCMAAVFQGDIIVVGHPVVALHPDPFYLSKQRVDYSARAVDILP